MATRRITGTSLPGGEEVVNREPWDLDARNDELRWRLAMPPDERGHGRLRGRMAGRPGGGPVWTIVDDGAGRDPQHIPTRGLLAEQSGT